MTIEELKKEMAKEQKWIDMLQLSTIEVGFYDRDTKRTYIGMPPRLSKTAINITLKYHLDIKTALEIELAELEGV